MSTRQVEQHRTQFAGALQSALTREEVARTYLDSVGHVINAKGLGHYELNEDGALVDVRATVTGEMLQEYEEYGRQDDPVLSFVSRHQRPIDSSRVVSSAEWEACGARSALGRAGYGHSLEAPIVVSGMLFGTINFARPNWDQAFDDEDLVSARLVSEQLGLATERALRFEMTGRRSSALEHALDRLPQAVIVSDLDAQIMFCNRTARNTLDLDPEDGSSRRGDVVAAAIDEAMESFRVEAKRVSTRSVWDKTNGRQSIVKSFRLSDKDRTAVTLVFPGAETSSARRLPVWDVLTRREQEIAQLVSEGLTSKQIAAKAFVSENTVKQHLKRVFAKTDVANRAELVQLIWSSGSNPED
jgi:DNA-binding CsgD family transcriptional regulator